MVVPIAITTEGRWLTSEDARRAIDAGPHALPDALPVEGAELRELGALVGDPREGRERPFDVAFPLLHGPYGEDGTVQGMLELAGIPYVGSGVLGSAVAMDKVMMKRAFAACGLATPRHLVLRDGTEPDELVDRALAELGEVCFVKPANMGSSIGVTKARGREQLLRAIEHAWQFDEWVLVEEAVAGREIEVAVLGDHPAEASVPGEVIPGDEFYSYADKYERHDAQLLAPARLTATQADEGRTLALAAFAACRVEAMARVDLFLEEERPDGTPGRGFLVNEVNTIPGFTPISMYPRLWQVSGLSYGALLDRLIELAFVRHARRTRRAGRQRG